MLLMLLVLLPMRVVSQGVFVYDQQSATESTGGGVGDDFQSNQPFGQSFVPSLSSVGFIRLFLYDFHGGDGLGTTISVNLRTNSITGPILSSTTPVSLPDGFGLGNSGYVDLIFSNPVAVTPGTTYYFQPVAQSGGSPDWAIVVYNGYGYAGGTELRQGQPLLFNDLWFREGVIVPEPSTACLVLLGSALLVHARKKIIQS
jgi:hypothetical protein